MNGNQIEKKDSSSDGCLFHGGSIIGLIGLFMIISGKVKFDLGYFSILILVLLVSIPMSIGLLFYNDKKSGGSPVQVTNSSQTSSIDDKVDNPWWYNIFLKILGVVLLLGGLSLVFRFYFIGILPLMLGGLFLGLNKLFKNN
jgi:hypothetical protein